MGDHKEVTPFISQLWVKKDNNRTSHPKKHAYGHTPLRPLFPALKPWIAQKGLKEFLPDNSGSPILASVISERQSDLHHVTQYSDRLLGHYGAEGGICSTGVSSCDTRMQRNPRILALALILNRKSAPSGGRSLSAGRIESDEEAFLRPSVQRGWKMVEAEPG